MYVLIDNYDSFTYNLYHYFDELNAKVQVIRNDQITSAEVTELQPTGVIISPGPGTPNETGISLELIKMIRGKIPLLGVCLGHQAIAQIYGGEVIRATKVMHGKTSMLYHNDSGLFKGLPSPYKVARYHSLVADPRSLPQSLDVTAWTEDGTIMGISDEQNCVHGVQFHPESVASEYGFELIQNFLNLAESYNDCQWLESC